MGSDHGLFCLLFALVEPQVSNLNYKVKQSQLPWFQTLSQVSNEQKKYVDVIPPQKGPFVDSEKGTNVET